jgi:trigger factor
VEKAALKIVRETVEPCRVKLTIEVPVQQVDAEFAKMFGEFHKFGKLDGFRPGKAPKAMVLRQFGARIREEARKELVGKTVEAAIEQEKLTPETQPRLENGDKLELKEGSPLNLTVTFDIAPEFPLPDYRNFQLQAGKPAEVTGESVDQFIKNLLQRRAEFSKVERPAQAGDMLKTSWKGTLAEAVDLAAIPEHSRYILENADGRLIMRTPEILPGAMDALIGSQAGDTKTFAVNFPANYFIKPLAGKQASYTVTVNEVQAPDVPEIDDKVAKDFGHETAADLKEAVAKHLANEEEQNRKEQLRNQVNNLLMAQVAQFPLPPAVVSRQSVDEFIRLFNNEIRNGRKENEVMAEQEKLMAQAKANIECQLRRSYILRAVAKAEKLSVSHDEISSAMASLAQMQQVTPQVLYKRLSDSGRIHDLYEHLLMNKTLDQVAGQCKTAGK